ncbi:MAG: metal-sulfur cluster assembly factor, partial [Candidatus Daviesbacteria bacterium]|nr:metal-sulfur cluster assembly factor [Candidatus Daviesbacteria bacterium]
DPELDINVVDMGLIYDIKETDGDAEILMTFTSLMCPYGSELKKAVKEAVRKVKGVTHVIVKLTFTPLWKPDKISKEARLLLGM